MTLLSVVTLPVGGQGWETEHRLETMGSVLYPHLGGQGVIRRKPRLLDGGKRAGACLILTPSPEHPCTSRWSSCRGRSSALGLRCKGEEGQRGNSSGVLLPEGPVEPSGGTDHRRVGRRCFRRRRRSEALRVASCPEGLLDAHDAPGDAQRDLSEGLELRRMGTIGRGVVMRMGHGTDTIARKDHRGGKSMAPFDAILKPWGGIYLWSDSCRAQRRIGPPSSGSALGSATAARRCR